MTKSLTVILIIITTGVFAQRKPFQKPDYNEIKRAIADVNSPMYYPQLLERYKTGDSTFTLQERRHLYYGYTFQPEYSPYNRSQWNDSTRTLLRKGRLTESEYRRIAVYCDSALLDNPFDLVTLDYALRSADELGDTSAFTRSLWQMRTIISALLSSGDGKTKADAFYVICTSDEYTLLSILDFEFGGEQSLIEHYDYLKVKKNKERVKGLYFDVTPCLNHLNKMFDEKVNEE